ncbi:unnamed protein product [Miscanthus lutarioriparius]|uniref:Uncharacterized protein n=1 Tax=Miscanthus lutarioriparius TaxID=422564 RepID=A0A811Q8L9_9POAL|nr:unnamed protein product [Miscanthus lutarioriparius]
MAEKISILIVVVDLDCHKCYHKIRKILCKLQDHERIRTISFDNKSKTITIVGPFDPQRLACKLRCKGGKVIKDVHIVDTNGGGGKPPPENMPDGPTAPAPAPVGKGKKKKKEKQPPPPPTERPPPPEQAPGPPPETMMPPPSSPAHHPPPPDEGMSAMVPQPHYVEEKPPRAELEPPMSPPPKEMPPMKPMDMAMPVPQHHPPPPCPGRPLEQPVEEYVIPTVEIPSWPAPPVGPCGCPCCAPCHQGYYGSCRCGCCGGVYGTTVRPLPPPCGAYRGCRTFSDDDPAACSIM